MKPSAAILYKAARELRRFAARLTDGCHRQVELHALAELVEPRRPVKKDVPRHPRAPPEMTTAEIAVVVRDRAGGICEACGKPFTGRDPFSLDHWENGHGRRKQKQCVANCWGIHKFSCHADRQEYRPSAAFWNALFKAHCEKYGYPCVAHVEHQPMKRRA